MGDWKKDTLVGSTVHGVNMNNGFMAAYNTVVGKYYNGGAKDDAGFAMELDDAFKANPNA
jgi:glucose/mannose transport system substrate-binding protein